MSASKPRASAADLEAFRLERLCALLSPVEQQAFWGGVLAALRSADRLDEGHTLDLIEHAKKKVQR